MKHWILFFFFILCFKFASSQQQLQYQRQLYQGIENPAQLHLQGIYSGKITLGSTFQKTNPKTNLSVDLTYFLKKHDFAFRLKTDNNYYGNHSLKRRKISMNTFIRVSKKTNLSIGLDAQILRFSVKFDELYFETHVDSTLHFNKSMFGEIQIDGAGTVASFNLALLYYDTAGRYFAGLIINDITEPYFGFYGRTGEGTVLPREVKAYFGFNFNILSKIRTTSTLLYLSNNYKKQWIWRQDIMIHSKYWMAYETDLKTFINLIAGYQPMKKINACIIVDVQPNKKAFSGNTNFYKLSLGYAL